MTIVVRDDESGGIKTNRDERDTRRVHRVRCDRRADSLYGVTPAVEWFVWKKSKPP